MKLHEYQAKSYFNREDIPIPRSRIASTPAEAKQIAAEIGYPVVLKAQVLVGGRGKAGGILLVKDENDLDPAANDILNSKIKGISVQRILVEQAINFTQEIYLGITVDRALAQPVIILSASGGVEIEELAIRHPNRIIRTAIDPLLGLQPYMVRAMASHIGLDYALWKPLLHIALSLWKLFDQLDATLVEINPLVITTDKELLALDGKMTIDDNALYRQQDFLELTDQAVETPAEQEARKFCLSYIQLSGHIGCMVNGAGLAMATMDCIQQAGGEPANFLDIGGGANADKVQAALRIILSDENVRAVLINIFGGITRCDEVAKGLISILPENTRNLPFIIRLEGTNAEEGRNLLAQVPNLLIAENLMQAAEMAVHAAERAMV
jgi:succinyl-CoA synthetase beta subunit